MPDAARRTELVVLALVVFTCLWTLGSGLLCGAPATVSGVVSENCQRHPILAFAMGVLVGHWLWPVN